MSRKEKSLEKNETILLSALRGIAKKIENEIDNSEVVDERKYIKVYIPDSFPSTFPRGSEIHIDARVLDSGDFAMDNIEISYPNRGKSAFFVGGLNP